MKKETEVVAPEPPVACDPSGVPADQKGRWIELGEAVYGSVQEVQELPDGYSLQLPNDQAMLLQLAEYVSLDRLCCEYINWTIEVKRARGPVWLHLTGGQGVKEELKNGFETIPLIREEVALAAGFSISNRKPYQKEKLMK